MNLDFFHFLSAGGIFFSTVFALTTLRYQSLISWYRFSVVFLAVFTLTIGIERGLESFYIAAGVIFVLKGLLIPGILFSVAQKSGIASRLQFFLRPASHYFVIVLTLAGLFWVFNTIPFFGTFQNGYTVYLSLIITFLGFLMMITHRDILSQIIGFLILENGITLFSTATLGSAPLILEIGISFVVILVTILMATLTKSVQELYGTSDTTCLSDLME
ncbi:MAG: hypothetical protein WCJ84_03380 [Candidatus Peregrinibacteria bacterium]